MSAMRGKLYGVEMKLTPENKPYLIEINGCDTWTGGFVSAYGDMKVQRTLLSRMASIANGKPIYSEHPLDHPIRDRLLMYLSRLAGLASNVLYGDLDLRAWWLEQPQRLGSQTRRRQARKFEADDLKKVAQELGIHYVPFTTLRVEYQDTIRLGMDKKKYRLHPESIGLLWLAESDRCFMATDAFNKQLINPYPIEAVLGSKIYLHRLLESSPMRDYLPRTVLLGPGISQPFPKEFERMQLIIKPNLGLQGIVARTGTLETLTPFLPRASRQAGDKIRREFAESSTTDTAFSRWAFKNLLDVMEAYSWLVQQYIPSRPVHAKTTGLDHESVIRALVFDGQFIDAHHQLAPTQTERVINIARGAILEPVADSDRELVKDFSENVIRTLEEKIEAERMSYVEGFRIFRERLWKNELRIT